MNANDDCDVRLSVVVMAHPYRLEAAELLCRQNPDLAARIVVDPEPDGPPSALRAARVAWQSVAPGASHHLVLQDDAILGPHFLERLTGLIAQQPEAAISLFTEWGSRTANSVRMAALLGYAWAPVVDDYLPSLALVLPAHLALGFEARAAAEATDQTDDVALLAYLSGTQTIVPVANLIDHSNPASLVGNDVMGPRSSVCFADTGVDDGSAVLPEPDTVPYFCWWEQLAVAYVRDVGAVDGWRRTPAEEALLARGVTIGQVILDLREALRLLPNQAFVTDRVSDVLLTELWTTAYLLGILTAETGPVTDPPSSIAWTALGTLAPGALRRVVPVPWLLPVGQLLTPLLDQGRRIGAARVGRP